MSDRIIYGDDPRIETGHGVMNAFWESVGRCDRDVISYLVNPQFQGKPAWPNMRQAYRLVRPLGTLIIASDGLSDPFVDTDMDDVSGFAMEVFIESRDLAGADIEAVKRAWEFKVIENFAMNVANWGGITEDLRAEPVMSMELPCEGVLPSEWLTEDATAGFLVNAPVAGRAKEVAMPLGAVMIVPLTLLRPNELKFAVQNGRAGRMALVEALLKSGYGHVSSLERSSVL
jgi:hypothetical protein